MRAPDLHCTTHCSCLIDLPPELIATICGFAECRTVLRCRSVCKRLRDVIDASLELQYRIELIQDGMVDSCAICPSHSQTPVHAQLTTAERLARLRQLRHAWGTLSWARCVTVPMPGPCCAYELVGGIFCKTQPGPAPRGAGFGVGFNPGLLLGLQLGLGVGIGEWDAHEAVVHPPPPQYVKMCAAWLPGREGHEQGKTVVRDDLGIPTRDFAMDPSQDLMILFKGDDVNVPMVASFLELHIRTLSTNQTHPETKKPTLCTRVMYPITSVFVQIVDDVVGVMYSMDPSRPRIMIWNWKTGNLVVDCSDADLPPYTSDFSFVNSRAFLMTTMGYSGGSLELFTFTCDPTNSASQPHSHLASTLRHVATLYFPQILPSAHLLSIGTHTGPFLSKCPPEKLFMASNEDRIHVLTIQYVHVPTPNVPRTRPKMCVFVHNRVLEEYMREGWERGTAIEVPWLEWGQTQARMLPYEGVFQWLRYVHGQRAVLLLPALEEGKSTLQVLDFNVRNRIGNGNCHHYYSEPTLALDGESRQRKTALDIVNHPSRIFMPSVFVDVVESGLPYRAVRRDVQGNYSGMMIDDERLVGLKYPAFLTGDMKEIDVFTM